MIFGVDYYPEHWNRDEWETQAKLMQKGGFNTVRMGEFAWKLFEKKEGEFDFSFLDDAIEILEEYGIKTILEHRLQHRRSGLRINMTSCRGTNTAEKRIGVQDVKAAETIRAT